MSGPRHTVPSTPHRVATGALLARPDASRFLSEVCR